MSEEKLLGRISAASFGVGGYQDAMIGLSLSFDLKGCGIGEFRGTWSGKRSEFAKWTDESRIEDLGKIVMQIDGILRDAKKKDVAALVGTPVEVTIEGNTLRSWRVLTEVL